MASVSYRDINQYYNWVDWMTHTQKVLAALDGARGNSFASVAAIQTYFQTGDRKSLDQLSANVAELRRKAAAVRDLTAAWPNSADSTRSINPNCA